MVALTSLSTASILLQQTTSKAASLGDEGPGRSSQTQPTIGPSPAIGFAAKTVGSAIFNAVSVIGERQKETIKAVLDYIDREYVQSSEDIARTDPELAARPAFQDAASKQAAVGMALKQEVLADPAAILKLIEQIKAQRPDVSKEGVFGLMIAELGSRKSRAATSQTV
ncbi:hypothetical protein [Aureimonas ureilytica]|nr:hypothetical protein [Aureimonas ureilytica]